MTAVPIRPALLAEIPILARHHRMMFEAIWRQKGLTLSPLAGHEIEVAYRNKLDQQLPQGTCRSWVAEQGGHIVASGAVSIASLVPVPGDGNHQVAYVHTIFTEKDFRRQGWAGRITETILADCKNRGIKRILLNASAQGRPLYEKLGFQPLPEMMRLLVG